MKYIISDQGFLASYTENWNEITRNLDVEILWVEHLSEARPFETVKGAKSMRDKVGGFIWNMTKQQPKLMKRKWLIEKTTYWFVRSWIAPIKTDKDFINPVHGKQLSNFFFTKREAVMRAKELNLEIIKNIEKANRDMQIDLNVEEGKTIGIL
jgi:hypothetical protein